MGIYVSQMFEDPVMKEIAAAYGVGIETIDFARSDYLDEPDHAAAYKKRLAEMGTDDVIVHGPFFDLNPVSFDRKIAGVSAERMEQAYQAARLIGSRKMVFHSAFIPGMVFREGWAERMKDFWSGFISGKKDLEIRMENVVDPDPYLLRDFIQASGSPRIRICLDIGHMNCASEVPAAEWVKVLGSLTRELHLHDNHGSGDEHLGLGRGLIAWPEIVESVLVQSPDCDLTLECPDRKDAEESVRKIREVIGK